MGSQPRPRLRRERERRGRSKNMTLIDFKHQIFSSSKDKKAQAMMCLVSGKRHLLVQDISSAVTSLGEACELLAEEFGDKAPECAEAYFYYGKALLEMFRLEAGVLGNIDGEGEDSNRPVCSIDFDNLDEDSEEKSEEKSDDEEAEEEDGADGEDGRRCW